MSNVYIQQKLKDDFIADGTVAGIVTVNSTAIYAQGALVTLLSDTQPTLLCIVWRIITSTTMSIREYKPDLGPSYICTILDTSDYTTADNAYLRLNQQTVFDDRPLPDC